MATKKPTRMDSELVEMAGAQRRLGIMDDETYRKITIRHLGPDAPAAPAPITAAEIRSMREDAHLSQAVFARYLNLTVGYVSQLERGAKRPTGPALVLLNVIRRRGIEAIL